MPKMKKEKLDEIAALIKEGYTNEEIAKRLMLARD
jgi:DNA-binding CsgD family transcriptional regulator